MVAKDNQLVWAVFAPDLLLPPLVFLSSYSGMPKGIHLVLEVQGSERGGVQNQIAWIQIWLSSH